MQFIKIMTAAFMLLVGAYEANAADEAMPAGVHVKEVRTVLGLVQVLADANGMTLYTFDMDKDNGKSACNGPCADIWPPLMAGEDVADEGAWTVVVRNDGSKMWAYHGKPLYTFVKDKAQSDFNGDSAPKYNPVWHYAVPK